MSTEPTFEREHGYIRLVRSKAMEESLLRFASEGVGGSIIDEPSGAAGRAALRHLPDDTVRPSSGDWESSRSSAVGCCK
jgi:hypothetical protein